MFQHISAAFFFFHFLLNALYILDLLKLGHPIDHGLFEFVNYHHWLFLFYI